jgi:2-(3-amino-3-carboxypropyl)histidine synthase
MCFGLIIERVSEETFKKSQSTKNSMEYDLELDKVVEEIKKAEAKTVLIQLGDGLKPQGTQVVDFLEKETGATIFLWLESCYGVCDVPPAKVDLVVQFGHNELQPTF